MSIINITPIDMSDDELEQLVNDCVEVAVAEHEARIYAFNHAYTKVQAVLYIYAHTS